MQVNQVNPPLPLLTQGACDVTFWSWQPLPAPRVHVEDNAHPEMYVVTLAVCPRTVYTEIATMTSKAKKFMMLLLLPYNRRRLNNTLT